MSKSPTGVPETYTVAANDDFNTIADRLGLIPGYLYTLNMVRRADLELYVGDVLNLNPRHISTVGDENGVVSHLALPDGAPPQG